MAVAVKLKGVVKCHGLDSYNLGDAMHKLLAKHGRSFWTEGLYRVSLSVKVGKRWKLKSYTVEVYNKFPCECCGP